MYVHSTVGQIFQNVFEILLFVFINLKENAARSYGMHLGN